MREVNEIINDVLVPLPKHARFNLAQNTRTTMRIGELTPIFSCETVPGGKYTLSSQSLVKFAPLVAPVMHRMYLKTFYFHIPFRLLWDGWPDFIRQAKDPQTGLSRVQPVLQREQIPNLSTNSQRMMNYFSYTHAQNPIPINAAVMSAWDLSAYQLVWNWYFRHKAVREEAPYKLEDGVLSLGDMAQLAQLRKIVFRNDYFNSALPTPQKGEPVFVDSDAKLYRTDNVGGAIVEGVPVDPATPNLNDVAMYWNEQDPAQAEAYFSRVRIIAEEIRRASMLQKFVELMNHANDYLDYLKAMHNVDLPDYTYRAPKYLCGSAQPITVSEVVNNGSDFLQGRQTGQASSFSQSDSETFFSHEHGLILGLAVVTYEPAYTRSAPKHLFKTQPTDYFNPLFDTLGEQSILRGELDSSANAPYETFGYVPRNSEYRTNFDRITGQMQTYYNHFTLSRNLATPTLTEDFYDVPDDRRIFAVQDSEIDPIILEVDNDLTAIQPIGSMPTPSVV